MNAGRRPQTSQKARNSQNKHNIEREEHKVVGMAVVSFKINYKATVIKPVWYWHKTSSHRSMNRIESPEINPHTYGQLIYDKGG